MRLIFLTPSLIGSINDRMFILTNRQEVLMGMAHFFSRDSGDDDGGHDRTRLRSRRVGIYNDFHAN